ncbi:MAG: hypothetical protein KIT11_02375 [Fimbriimonadaceae bacterium]|nr:hypothetical protein [Fimbriimonadaceae bacterium]QYK54785.1 MAG: hypothetical protein KF733_07160 [Fimbriimonadaceae bacterium]
MLKTIVTSLVLGFVVAAPAANLFGPARATQEAPSIGCCCSDCACAACNCCESGCCGGGCCGGCCGK